MSERRERIPSHHPVEEYLLDYALGHLSEAWSLAIATHLTFCPECRASVAALEGVAGKVIADMDAVPLRAGSLDEVLSRLDTPGPASPAARDPVAQDSVARDSGDPVMDGLRLPKPLLPYLQGSGNRRPDWRRVMTGLEEVRLPVGDGAQKATLMRIQPGRAMPWHTHRGEEMTVVLDGGFVDASGEFRRGDCALLDGQVDHQPVAMDDGPCICLAVTDAPLKLTGPIGRWLNPLVRY